jgi:hypothetical protein
MSFREDDRLEARDFSIGSIGSPLQADNDPLAFPPGIFAEALVSERCWTKIGVERGYYFRLYKRNCLWHGRLLHGIRIQSGQRQGSDSPLGGRPASII